MKQRDQGPTEIVCVTEVRAGDEVFVGVYLVRIDDVEVGTATVRSVSTGEVREFACRVFRYRGGMAAYAETESVLRVRPRNEQSKTRTENQP